MLSSAGRYPWTIRHADEADPKPLVTLGARGVTATLGRIRA